MLASTIISNVLLRLEELPASPIFWSRAELLVLLNDGNLELVLSSGYLNSERVQQLIGAKVQAVPMDAIALLGVQYAGVQVERTTIENLDRTNRRWDYQSGILSKWAPMGCEAFVVDRQPTSELTVLLQTLDMPAPLTEASTVDLEPEYCKALEDYVFHCARFKEGGTEFQMAQGAYDDFSAKAGMREQRTFSEMFVLWGRTPQAGDTGGSYSTMERA